MSVLYDSRRQLINSIGGVVVAEANGACDWWCGIGPESSLT